MRSFFFIVLAAALPTRLVGQQIGDLVIQFTAGESSKLGLFFAGDQRIEPAIDPEFDKFIATIEPSTHNSQNSKVHESFTLRSTDFSFRAKVTIWENLEEDQNSLPYLLSIKNLMWEGGPEANIELKHADKGFQWIDPGIAITHKTDVSHNFELRNSEHKTVAVISLHPPNKEEL